jgi:uncharacterized pyridoxamine 5'-phosphate oxidase family protein
MNTYNKAQRIRQELLKAGVTRYGLSKSESRAMHDYIADNEHVLAVIYGQFESSSAMMVATDHRLLFINIRAFNTVVDETSYEMIGDVTVNDGVLFSSVMVRTRPREYSFTMVNKRCARRFLNVIEQVSIEPSVALNPALQKISAKYPLKISKKAATGDEIAFLHQHTVASLSTRGDDGYPYAATVFYFYDKLSPDYVYVATKSTTPSSQNIEKNNKIGLTVTDSKRMITLHIKGRAEIENNRKQANTIINLLFANGTKLTKDGDPPVLRMKEGSLLVYKVAIDSAYMHSYA